MGETFGPLTQGSSAMEPPSRGRIQPIAKEMSDSPNMNVHWGAIDRAFKHESFTALVDQQQGRADLEPGGIRSRFLGTRDQDLQEIEVRAVFSGVLRPAVPAKRDVVMTYLKAVGRRYRVGQEPQLEAASSLE